MLIINRTLSSFGVDANIVNIIIIFIVIILSVNGPLGSHNAVDIVLYKVLSM